MLGAEDGSVPHPFDVGTAVSLAVANEPVAVGGVLVPGEGSGLNEGNGSPIPAGPIPADGTDGGIATSGLGEAVGGAENGAGAGGAGTDGNPAAAGGLAKEEWGGTDCPVDVGRGGTAGDADG